MQSETVLCLLSKGDSSTAYQLAQKFSTKDQDNDGRSSRSDAVFCKGAWWYGSNTHANLNGVYYTGGIRSEVAGVWWWDWTLNWYSLKFTEMKLKPFHVWLALHTILILVLSTLWTWSCEYVAWSITQASDLSYESLQCVHVCKWLFYAHLCDRLHSISMRISNSTSLIIKLAIEKEQTHFKFRQWITKSE